MLRSLWVGILIALPSGAGVALAILGGNTGSLVGVAISASLLPPLVNAVSWTLHYPISGLEVVRGFLDVLSSLILYSFRACFGVYPLWQPSTVRPEPTSVLYFLVFINVDAQKNKQCKRTFIPRCRDWWVGFFDVGAKLKIWPPHT